MNKDLLIFIIFLILGFISGGCSAKEIIVEKPIYKEVYIPTKCQVKMPKKPIKTNNIIETNLNILKYLKELEIALDFCQQ